MFVKIIVQISEPPSCHPLLNHRGRVVSAALPGEYLCCRASVGLYKGWVVCWGKHPCWSISALDDTVPVPHRQRNKKTKQFSQMFVFMPVTEAKVIGFHCMPSFLFAPLLLHVLLHKCIEFFSLFTCHLNFVFHPFECCGVL